MQELDQTKNVRNIIGLDDTELRASMEKSGWIPQFPAFADENGTIIVGHRRMKIAEELGLTPVIETIHFGNGSEGDAKRLELAIASNIGAAGLSKKDRQSIAQRASDCGYTQEQIGKILGVSQQAISKLNLQPGCNSKPARTKTNPRGAGRPRSSHPKQKYKSDSEVTSEKPVAVREMDLSEEPFKDDREDEAIALYDSGMTIEQIDEHFCIKRNARHMIEHGLIRRFPRPLREDFPLTAQQKFDRAIQHHKDKLDAERHLEIRKILDELLNTTIGPRLVAEQKEARRVIQGRKGIMDRNTYRKIKACLHPDWVTDEKQKERYAEAFRAFEEVEGLILDEKNKPNTFTHIPRTREEWAEIKRQVSAARAEKRRARKEAKKEDNDLKRAN